MKKIDKNCRFPVSFDGNPSVLKPIRQFWNNLVFLKPALGAVLRILPVKCQF